MKVYKAFIAIAHLNKLQKRKSFSLHRIRMFILCVLPQNYVIIETESDDCIIYLETSASHTVLLNLIEID